MCTHEVSPTRREARVLRQTCWLLAMGCWLWSACSFPSKKRCRTDAQCVRNGQTDLYYCAEAADGKRYCEPYDCLKNADCKGRRECVDGKCSPTTKGCDNNEDCADNKICEKGACIHQTCRDNGDCDPGDRCDSGICVEERCSEDGDCQAGQTCVRGTCQAQGTCGTCPPDKRCKGGGCVYLTGCKQNDQLCDNLDFDAGEACRNDTCRIKCDKDDKCPNGYTCKTSEGICYNDTNQCDENQHCPSGQVCGNDHMCK